MRPSGLYNMWGPCEAKWSVCLGVPFERGQLIDMSGDHVGRGTKWSLCLETMRDQVAWVSGDHIYEATWPVCLGTM